MVMATHPRYGQYVRVAGIAVDIPSRGRPTARFVALDDASGSPVLLESDSFTGDDVDIPMQLHETAKAVRSRLKAIGVDRVVIRRADRSPRASNTDGPRLRLLMEGAVVSSARSTVVSTFLGTGKDTGSWFGSNKEGVDAAAQVIVDAHGLAPQFLEAVSAGLAGLALP
jgi:hypothetical protein